MFNLVSNYKPNGDQRQAIKELVDGLNSGKKDQVLLGATGKSLIITNSFIHEKIKNKKSLDKLWLLL